MRISDWSSDVCSSDLMSVDANVLINERIREELRAGMPAKTAIATGYDRASGTIFDSTMTALLAGVALFAFGTGPLKGFANTMIVGILPSLYTAVTCSRRLATLTSPRPTKPKNHPLRPDTPTKKFT